MRVNLERFKKQVFGGVFLLFVVNIIALFPGSEDLSCLQTAYKRGYIECQPILEIGIDNFPDNVAVKRLDYFFTSVSGDIYLSDYDANNIKVVDSSGKFKFSFGKKGRGPGDLLYPSMLANIADLIYVYERGNNRFSIFNQKGLFKKHFNYKEKRYVTDIKLLDNGMLVLEFEKYYQDRLIFGRECTLVLCSADLNPIRTLFQRKIAKEKVISKPKPRLIPMPFQPKLCWDVLPGAKIVYSYSEKYEFWVHDVEHDKISRFSHSNNPVKVTAEDEKQFFDRLLFFSRTGVRKGADQNLKNNTDFPEFKPAFKAIISDYDGNILVFPYQPFHDEAVVSFDVFERSGLFVQRVLIKTDKKLNPKNIRFSSRRNIWGFVKNDDDENVLINFEIN